VLSRTFGIAAVGGLMAAVALAGCASKGDDYGAGNQPNLTNATSDPSAPPSAAATPTPTKSAAKPVKLTDELRAKTIAKMGKVVTDQNGWVLYRFDTDTAKPAKSNCVQKCAKIWPPAATDGNPKLTGVDPALVGTVSRDDGTMQITLNGWPLYRYVGDLKPGQWKGQNVGGTWFVAAPDGKKNLTCLPSPPPKAVAPPADDADTNSSTSNSGNDGY
jgi:predicted lipoprotein with Yx(FWY)xxD motif